MENNTDNYNLTNNTNNYLISSLDLETRALIITKGIWFTPIWQPFLQGAVTLCLEVIMIIFILQYYKACINSLEESIKFENETRHRRENYRVKWGKQLESFINVDGVRNIVFDYCFSSDDVTYLKTYLDKNRITDWEKKDQLIMRCFNINLNTMNTTEKYQIDFIMKKKIGIQFILHSIGLCITICALTYKFVHDISSSLEPIPATSIFTSNSTSTLSGNLTSTSIIQGFEPALVSELLSSPKIHLSLSASILEISLGELLFVRFIMYMINSSLPFHILHLLIVADTHSPIPERVIEIKNDLIRYCLLILLYICLPLFAVGLLLLGLMLISIALYIPYFMIISFVGRAITIVVVNLFTVIIHLIYRKSAKISALILIFQGEEYLKIVIRFLYYVSCFMFVIIFSINNWAGSIVVDFNLHSTSGFIGLNDWGDYVFCIGTLL